MALFLPQGASGRKKGRGWKTGVSPFFESILFSSFFFFFFSPSLFAILLVSEAIHARMVTNEWSGGVKVEKVEAAMRSVEMIRTVEQVGAPLKYLLEIDYRGCRMPRYGDD